MTNRRCEPMSRRFCARKVLKWLRRGTERDALSMVQHMQGTVDVLVTDIRMPRMTGIELVRAVKIDFPGIPVVYISGEAMRDELHNPRARVVFVQKPFRPQAILTAVRTVVAMAGRRPGLLRMTLLSSCRPSPHG